MDIIDAIVIGEELTALSDLLTERQWNIALYQSEDLTRNDICVIMGLPLWKVKYEIYMMRRTLKNVARRKKK
jgi:DNA-directed RNA polymerase specialized sigma24 family protein